jgi:hypothetical protein
MTIFPRDLRRDSMEDEGNRFDAGHRMLADKDQRDSERSVYKTVAHFFPESPIIGVPPGLRPGVNLYKGKRIIVDSGVTYVVAHMLLTFEDLS